MYKQKSNASQKESRAAANRDLGIDDHAESDNCPAAVDIGAWAKRKPVLATLAIKVPATAFRNDSNLVQEFDRAGQNSWATKFRRNIGSPTFQLSTTAHEAGIVQREKIRLDKLVAAHINDKDEFVRDVVNKIAAMNWQEIEPHKKIPEIETDSSETNEAFYDGENHVIKIGKGLQGKEFWDQILFESINAEMASKYSALDKKANTKVEGGFAPAEYGRKKAEIEYDVNRRYIQHIVELGGKKNEEGHKSYFPERSRGALEKSDISMKEFLASPHQPDEIGKSMKGLPTSDLYAFDQVANFQDGNWIDARVSSTLSNVWDEGTLKKPGTKLSGWRDLLYQAKENINWPSEKDKLERPGVYMRVIAQLGDLIREQKKIHESSRGFDPKHGARLKAWKQVMEKLKNLALPEKAGEFAQKQKRADLV